MNKTKESSSLIGLNEEGQKRAHYWSVPLSRLRHTFQQEIQLKASMSTPAVEVKLRFICPFSDLLGCFDETFLECLRFLVKSKKIVTQQQNMSGILDG